jgi:hypothetical protein
LRGTLNGKPFIATANPWKGDSHVITVNMIMRPKLGIESPVDVTLDFEVVKEPLLDLEIPPDLQLALKNNELASEAFKNLTPAHEKEFIFCVDEIKSPKFRQRHIGVSLAVLRQHRSLYENPAKSSQTI